MLKFKPINRFFYTILISITIGCTAKSPDEIPVEEQDELSLLLDEIPSDLRIIFSAAADERCDDYALISEGDINMENNTWNATNLSPGSYQQCIYHYTNGDETKLGWKWSYPESDEVINAYPQLIFGKKPWHNGSTSTALPVELSSINRLKAHYDTAIYHNEGVYNLAFDNWISSDAASRPEDIRYEFMIWEDYHAISVYGTFIANFSTPNGEYDLYLGDPTWEPEGTSWVYVAFVRTNPRTTGTVDIDLMLNYLIEQEIVPGDSFLSSIEFGTEVGNSTGYAVINSFAIDLE